ncbi:MAG TPA: DUF503 domain-containing protein [Clostridiaceae bacterium]|nr:DUF503 domain-containing protein [Clostridiaceae bacterium]
MKHRVLIAEVDIKLYESHSLKDKRKLRRKITDKMKASNNISLAETNQQELWDLIGLTIAYVAIDQSRAEKKAEKLENDICKILEQDGSGELIRYYTEII